MLCCPNGGTNRLSNAVSSWQPTPAILVLDSRPVVPALTAMVAEQWGRGAGSRSTLLPSVALALARARIMGARYPYAICFADSRDGQMKRSRGRRENRAPSETPTQSTNDVRQGFVYERVPHITLKSIANNSEIDVIWDEYQAVLEPLRRQLNESLKMKWEEWEIPRNADEKWPTKVKDLHSEWWTQRIARQKAIDKSIAAKAEFEYLYDKPYEDNKKVRVAGPFTVESLSPHRVLSVDENDELIHRTGELGWQPTPHRGFDWNFVEMILENLKTAGVQQAHKDDKKSRLPSHHVPWPVTSFAPRGSTSRAMPKQVQRSEPPSSSAQSLERCPAPILSLPPARQAMLVSTCSSPVPSITTPTLQNSTSSGGYRS